MTTSSRRLNGEDADQRHLEHSLPFEGEFSHHTRCLAARPLTRNTADAHWCKSNVATGQIDPISSRRWRRSLQPIGRGFDAKSARIVSISL